MSWIEEPVQGQYYHNESNQIVNLTELAIDQYYVFFKASERFNLYTKEEDCIACPFKEKITISNYFSIPRQLSSKYRSIWRVLKSDNLTEVCEFVPEVGEFGVYEFNINKTNGNYTCWLDTLVEPVNIYLPILITILIYLGLFSFLYLLKWLYWRYFKKTKNHSDTTGEPKKQRIQSLDTFRGISIVLMILVNYGGGDYNFLDHATWNGLTIADLVFPWFMWIMGVCIPISVKSALRREEKYIIWNIFRRSCILFMLGLSLNRIPSASIINGEIVSSLEKLRIFGVLQRFGICYFVVATINLYLTKYNFIKLQNKIFEDIISLLTQWICILIIVITYIACIFGVDVPDCPKGYLGPGGLHENGSYPLCVGGAAGYIDRAILGENHLYRYPTSYPIYLSSAFDPEGPFGLLTSIFQVFLGVQAGTILQIHKKHRDRVIRWIVWGTIAGLIGGALCGFSQEDGVIPVNKNLWSLSYVLVTSCFAFFLLTCLYAVIDIKKWWSGRPFLYAGMNATIMYVGHSITYNMFPFQWGVLATHLHFQRLVQAVWGTSLWVGIAYWLYKIEFFLSL